VPSVRAGIEGSPVSSLNCDRQQNREFRGRFAICYWHLCRTADVLLRHAEDVGLPHAAFAEQAVREAATICPRPCDLDL